MSNSARALATLDFILNIRNRVLIYTATHLKNESRMPHGVLRLGIVLLVATVVSSAVSSFDVLVDTRVRITSGPKPRPIVAPVTRVALDSAFDEISPHRLRAERQARIIAKHIELHRGGRKLLAASDPLLSAAMLVPGLLPRLDPVTKQPVVEAWFFIQRGVERNGGVDQLLIETAEGGISTEYVNTQSTPCGADIGGGCSYTMLVTFEPTCHDVVGFGADTFSNRVFCQQRVTFSPVPTGEKIRSIGVTIDIDIAKAVPTLGLRVNTTLTARLRYVDEEELVVSPIALPDVTTHFSVGRYSLMSPTVLTTPEPEYVVEGEDLCTTITVNPALHAQSGMRTTINTDIVEVAMCTKEAPVQAWEVPAGEDQDPTFSCMAYTPKAKVNIIYSQRFEQCIATNGTSSRLGGCCSPEEVDCAIVDTLNTRFQCVDLITGEPIGATCTKAHAASYTPGRECPTGSVCANSGTEPLVLLDAPVNPTLFPYECLNPTATAMVDCSTSTAGCLDPTGCSPMSSRVAFCMHVPTFREERNKTKIMYEFRLELTVVDFRQGHARRLLRDDETGKGTRLISTTKPITVLSKPYRDAHPLAAHWTHALAEDYGIDFDNRMHIIGIVAFAAIGAVSLGTLLILKLK